MASVRLKPALLIIPSFNQASELPPLLDRLKRCYSTADVLVVDDGSTDGSADLAHAEGFRVSRHGNNLGVGAAIRTGIQFAEEGGYDLVCIFSANGKMLPEEIERIVAPVASGQADYVTGSRFLPGGSCPGLPLFRRLAIPLFSWLCAALLKRRFSDITCGFRAYRLALLKSAGVDLDQSWLNGYELEYYIHYQACRLGARILEVPVTISYSHLSRDRRTKIVPFVGWWGILRPFILLKLGLKR